MGKLLGERLREMRERYSYTQEDVAARLSVDRVTVSRHEKGDRDPGLDTLAQYARLYHATTDYLLGVTSPGAEDVPQVVVVEAPHTCTTQRVVLEIEVRVSAHQREE